MLTIYPATEDDDLLLEAPPVLPASVKGIDVQAIDMHIDEEGRPVFAPDTSAVSSWHLHHYSFPHLLRDDPGNRTRRRDAQGPHSATPHDSPQKLVVKDLPPAGRASQAASPHEPQDQIHRAAHIQTHD